MPDGFTDTVIANPAGNPLSGPTDITPLPDGRALVLEKAGAVRVLDVDGSLLAADALTLGVCTASEQGLLGAAVDPGFAANGFVYLFYSRSAGGCANRVSRFTMTGATLGAEQILLDNMAITAGNHDGGDLHFGADGYLYVSVGDAGNPPAAAPRTSASSTARSCGSRRAAACRPTTRSSAAPARSRAPRPA